MPPPRPEPAEAADGTDPDGQSGLLLHASAVAAAGRAVLILGPSGAGKSSLALELLSRGARLVADDRVHLRRARGALVASAPPRLSGLIEVRGVGILHAPAHGPAPVALAVDLAAREDERLPPRRSASFLDIAVTLLHDPATPCFPAAIMLYLRGGRLA